MIPGIESMTAEQVAEALSSLQDRDRVLGADKRAADDIDRTLTRRLHESGVALGDPWELPETVSRAYPKGWAVQHVGHWWDAACNAAMSEPGEGNPDWVLNDPEPADGGDDAG